MAVTTMEQLGALLKTYYLPAIQQALNQQSHFLEMFGSSEAGRLMAARAEELTLMLAEGPRDFIPTELHEVGKLLGFKDVSGWALPEDHPLAVAA